MTLPPLRGFLQNCRNFSHVNGLKAIIGEIDALLQEFHQMVEQMAKIPAFTQDFAASSYFPIALSAPSFPLPTSQFPLSASAALSAPTSPPPHLPQYRHAPRYL
ncbi:hypothetical protein ABEV00_19710 [Paenibacillus thiaminolyticus]|uniref:hypothetical protein n=1 Tax=Paenibacillus thiaminolyticus TaxID=49283 RepID=UPI003D295E5D